MGGALPRLRTDMSAGATKGSECEVSAERERQTSVNRGRPLELMLRRTTQELLCLFTLPNLNPSRRANKNEQSAIYLLIRRHVVTPSILDRQAVKPTMFHDSDSNHLRCCSAGCIKQRQRREHQKPPELASSANIPLLCILLYCRIRLTAHS